MRLFTEAVFTFENESVHLCDLDTLAWGYKDFIMYSVNRTEKLIQYTRPLTRIYRSFRRPDQIYINSSRYFTFSKHLSTLLDYFLTLDNI